MADRYSANDRYRGGSMLPRLNPKIVNPELNAKLGPRLPTKERREEPGKERRRSVIGLPSRFDNKG